jgi:hypothetical protein
MGHVGTSDTIGDEAIGGVGHDVSARANECEKPNIAMVSKSGTIFIFGANLDLIKSHVNLPPAHMSALFNTKETHLPIASLEDPRLSL